MSLSVPSVSSPWQRLAITRRGAQLVVVLSLWCWDGGAWAQAETGPMDPILTAMGEELQRSVDRLELPDYPLPYYVAYTVQDIRRHDVAAKLGAVFEDSPLHERFARVDVRVGDYELDSSEDQEPEWPLEESYEPDTAVPLDGHVLGLRHTLWLQTDVAYKQAVSSYLKVKGARVFRPAPRRHRASFSRAEAALALSEPRRLRFDHARWRAAVQEASRVLAAEPTIFDSVVHIEARLDTRWFVNSEGTRLLTLRPLYAAHLMAWTRAPDGMLLHHSVDAYAATEEGMPSHPELVDRARELGRHMGALAAAPELGPYTGPAILEPSATGVFFHEVLGHRLEAHRLDSEEEGQTFADHLGKPVLPAFLSMADDPTLAHHEGIALNGAYGFDDEGVRARRVLLVDRGILRGFLMGRRPAAGFAASNGHGRAQGIASPTARMGTLVVEAHQAVSRRHMKSLLLDEVRRQGKPFGLIIRHLSGGSTNTSSYGYQAFKGEVRMAFKVDARTGKEMLIRGVDLVGTPLSSLSKIVAASRETGVFNGYCGAESGMVPVSTIAPAILFREIELQRSARDRSRGPILEAPGRPTKAKP